MRTVLSPFLASDSRMDAMSASLFTCEDRALHAPMYRVTGPPSTSTLTALNFLSEENWISSISLQSLIPKWAMRASMVRFLLPVADANAEMSFVASSLGMKSYSFSYLSLLVVMVPVLSMQTVSTWLIDSTELALCRSTPLSAMRIAAIMYVRVISRKSAMGTMSRQRTKISRV